MAKPVGQVYDVTARKFHQAICVFLVATAYVAGGSVAVVLLVGTGAVLLAGRFWWQLDVFRQLAWGILEPAGILHRHEVAEDHETRRVARVLGGGILIAAAVLVAAGMGWAWIGTGLIGVMIALDALFDFCALCAITHRIRVLQIAHQG